MSGKRIVAGIVSLIMFAAIIGCSTSEKSDNASTAGNQNTGQGESAATDSKKNEQVYIYANAGNLALASTLSKKEDLEMVHKEILDRSGFEVEANIPPKGQEAEKLNLLLASNEPIDIFVGNIGAFRDNGAIQPLNDLLDKYGSHIRELWPKEWASAWDAVTDKEGKIWAIPQVPQLAEKTIFLRSDWLAKLNLTMPKTIEEYETVLKALKEKDPAGAGQTIPIVTNMTGLNLALSAGFMDVGYGPWMDQDGKVKPPEVNPGYKDFIAKMAEWYQKGYIYKETFTLNTERTRELIKQNRVGSAIIHYSVVTNIQSDLQQKTPEALYEVAGELKGPKGNITTMSGLSPYGWMLNKKSKNPEAAIKFIDWIHSDIENYLLIMYGIKDKHWKYTDEANHVFERLNQDYAGEYLTASTFAYTVQFAPSDPASKPEYDFLGKYSGDTSRVKNPATADVDYLYDQQEISDKLPHIEDINRMIEEEVVKFIMGARPMSDYDKFVQELYSAGLDKWIEVMTEQYNKVKAAMQ